MRYYSDITKLFYDSEAKCAEDEQRLLKARADEKAAAEKKATERATRAKEIEAAYQAVKDATKHYNELLSAFIEDYGSFHMSWSSPEDAEDEDVFSALAHALVKFF